MKKECKGEEFDEFMTNIKGALCTNYSYHNGIDCSLK